MEFLLVLNLVFLWLMLIVNLLATVGLSRRLSAIGQGDGHLSAPSFSEDDLVPVNQSAPDFHAETLDGSSVALTALVGKPLALIFLGPSCRACRDLPVQIAAWEPRLRQAGAQFLVISIGRAEETRQMFGELVHSVQVCTIPSPRAPLIEAYRAQATPCYYLIDGAGTIVTRRLGATHLSEDLASFAARSAERQTDVHATAME